MNCEFVEEILWVGNLFCELETKVGVTSCFCELRVGFYECQF